MQATFLAGICCPIKRQLAGDPGGGLGVTYIDLAETGLKVVILLPQQVQGGRRHGYCLLVRCSQGIYLLCILPTCTSNVAWSRLDKIYVVLPEPARILVHSDVVDSEVEGVRDDFIRLVNIARRHAVAAPDVADVQGPQLDIGHSQKRSVEYLLHVVKGSTFVLPLSTNDPLLGLLWVSNDDMRELCPP